jgi:DNA polymerase III alpha subunit
MNDFAKLIPARPGIKLSQALEESVELKKVYDTSDTYRKVVDVALRMEGTIRQL